MKFFINLIGYTLLVVFCMIAVSMTLYSLFYSFNIVDSLFGSVVAYISLIFLPFLWGATPLYALFAYGDWTLLLFTYGAIPVAMIGVGISSFLFNMVED